MCFKLQDKVFQSVDSSMHKVFTLKHLQTWWHKTSWWNLENSCWSRVKDQHGSFVPWMGSNYFSHGRDLTFHIFGFTNRKCPFLLFFPPFIEEFSVYAFESAFRLNLQLFVFHFQGLPQGIFKAKHLKA